MGSTDLLGWGGPSPHRGRGCLDPALLATWQASSAMGAEDRPLHWAAGAGRGPTTAMGTPATWMSGKKGRERGSHTEENTSVPETIIQCHALRGAARNIVLRNFPKPWNEGWARCLIQKSQMKSNGATSGHPCLAKKERHPSLGVLWPKPDASSSENKW